MTYEYQCRECGSKWEEEQRITDPPTRRCAVCLKETAMRLISQGTFILNGAGWFKKGGY